MIKPDKYEDDLLRHYVNPESIEKAPEGFTAKIMARIELETEAVPLRRKFHLKSYVPLISTLITAGLVIAAVLLSGKGTHFPDSPAINLIKNFVTSLTQINLNALPEFHFPGWISYAFIGIFVLTIFDRALSGFFHREKK